MFWEKKWRWFRSIFNCERRICAVLIVIGGKIFPSNIQINNRWDQISALILFFMQRERAKCLVENYVKVFDRKFFPKATNSLEQKGSRKCSANLSQLFVSKYIYLAFFITHFGCFPAPYIYNCSLKRRFSCDINIIGLAFKRLNCRQFH